MAHPQLKLVTDKHPGFDFSTTDTTRQIFEHWLYMNARSPLQCKLGPQRRQVIDAALAIGYTPDQLMAAIEGMAADSLADVDKARMRDAMREIEWLLAREARIERWASSGMELRQRAASPAPEVNETAAVPDPEAAAAGRERLRELAQRLRGGSRH